MDKYCFQNCQKIVIFSENNSKVLLAKRKSEIDYDGTYSFIGGKMEITDKDLVDGMRREKNEEIGKECRILLNPIYSTSFYYVKKDGSCMVLPHYYARFIKGDIKLNDEYSEYKWININNLDTLEPKIPNIPEFAKRLLKLVPLMKDKEFIEI